MTKLPLLAAVAAGALSLAACSSMGGDSAAMANAAVPTVGGAAMYPTKTIVENASQSADHTTLVAAVKAAGLVDTLSGPGPFTVFAPTNAAFGKLPAGTVDTLIMPQNKATLTKVLTYHVVPGRLSAADLMKRSSVTTVEGEMLKVTTSGGMVMLTDTKGGMSTVTQADVFQSNGVVHVVDTVLMPTM